MLLSLVLGMLDVLDVLAVLVELVMLVGGIFERGIFFFQSFHAPPPSSPDVAVGERAT